MLTTFPEKAALTIAGIMLLFLGSCVRLPDYAQPHFYQNTDPLPRNVITYRNLTRADFQAKEPPSHLQDHTKHLNAHIVTSIRVAPMSRFSVSSTTIYGQEIYSGQMEEWSFEAVMSPANSWWNPHLEKGRDGYVLQHEQIHFALTEIDARRLTLTAAGERAALTVFDSSIAAVKKGLMEKINALITASRDDLLKEQTAFDQDTSMRYSPKTQQKWWQRVTEELQVPQMPRNK